jgi:hypothetical protein
MSYFAYWISLILNNFDLAMFDCLYCETESEKLDVIGLDLK